MTTMTQILTQRSLRLRMNEPSNPEVRSADANTDNPMMPLYLPYLDLRSHVGKPHSRREPILLLQVHTPYPCITNSPSVSFVDFLFRGLLATAGLIAICLGQVVVWQFEQRASARETQF